MKVEVIKAGFEQMNTLIGKGPPAIGKGPLPVDSEGTLRIKRIVNETLRHIDQASPAHKLTVDTKQMLSDLERFVLSDLSVLGSTQIKVFIAALGEFGLPKEQFLENIFIDVFLCAVPRPLDFQNFVEAFPELREMKDSQGRGLISSAILAGCTIKQVETLIDLGFNLSIIDEEGCTVVHMLAEKKLFNQSTRINMNLLHFFIKLLANNRTLDHKNKMGQTALHIAAASHNIVMFEALLLATGKANLEIEDAQGRRAIHLCFLEYHPDAQVLASMLLKKGVVLNSQDHQGNTPLHYASQKFDTTFIEAMARKLHFSEVNLKNTLGQTPADLLLVNPNLDDEIRGFLEKDIQFKLRLPDEQGFYDCDEDNDFDFSSANNRAELLLTFLTLDPKSDRGIAAANILLDTAFETGSEGLFFLYITMFEVSDTNKGLQRAVEAGNSRFLEIYLRVNEFENKLDESDYSTIELAVLSGDLETLRLCLRDGYDFGREGDGALRLAAEANSIEMVRELVKAGVFYPGAKIEGKYIIAYAYEHDDWDLILAIHNLHERDYIGRSSLYISIARTLKEFVISAAQRGYFSLVKDISIIGALDMCKLAPGMAIMEEAIKQKKWCFISQYIEAHPDYKEIEVDGEPLLFRMARDTQSVEKRAGFEMAALIGGDDLADAVKMHDGERFIDVVFSNRAWPILARFLAKVENVSVLGLDEQKVFDAVIADLTENSAWLVCKELIRNGVKLDQVIVDGLPFLHYIVRTIGEIEAAGVVLYFGDLIHQKDSFGKTPIFYAFQNKDRYLAGALISSGAKVYVEEWNFALSKNSSLVLFQKMLYLDENLNIDVDFRLITLLYGFITPSNQQLLDPGLEERASEMLVFLKDQRVDAVSEIPDTEYYGNPFTELREFFSTFTEVELEGVLGIDEAVVPVATQREAFKHFLKISETSEIITGVIRDDPSTSYRPIHRMLKHLAKALPSLRREEALTYLTQISRIELGYCIDPYQKVSKWIYGMLESSKPEELAVVVDLGDPIVSLRRDLYAKVREWRDMGMREILGETKGVIDTHARNWAYRYFGPEVGQSYDEVDIYLDAHGKSELAIYLNKIESRESILTELRQRFNSYFLGFAFQNIVRFLKRELASQERVGEGMAPKSSVVMDYFYELVNLEKIAGLERVMESSGERFKIQAYLKMRAYIKSLEGIVENHLGNIGRLEFILKYRQEAKVVEEDAEAVYAKKERIALSEQKIDEEMLLLAKFKGELALALEKLEFYYRDNRNLCRSVDYIEETASAKQTGLSEKYLTYSDTDEISISLEGSWEFFQLIMFHERTSL